MSGGNGSGDTRFGQGLGSQNGFEQIRGGAHKLAGGDGDCDPDHLLKSGNSAHVLRIFADDGFII
ncbi:hypothetical protein D3C75_1324710 [compost metagenome]